MFNRNKANEEITIKTTRLTKASCPPNGKVATVYPGSVLLVPAEEAKLLIAYGKASKAPKGEKLVVVTKEDHLKNQAKAAAKA